jgi:OFA family oxalate/formate antiporter-like MFS transporter
MIWAAYGCGVAAGLMAIGHAAGIAATQGFSSWVAASTIASANLVGSVLFGWLSDRVSHHSMLTTLPLISAMALIGFSVFLGQTLTLLGILGFAYGGTIAAYPVAITTLFPGRAGPPHAYGLIFTPWGAAGLLAPWLAGQIYEWAGNYTTALWLAARLSIISVVTAQKIIWKY